MTTYRELVSSISSTLRQVYKDRKIEPFEILYWILLFSSKLKSQHLTNSFMNSSWISGEYITTFTVPVATVFGKKYFKLPSKIINYKSREGGIDFITYNLQDGAETPDIANNAFTRVSASEVTRLYYNVHEEPSPANPYFYRLGDDVFLLGLEKIRVDTLSVGLVIGASVDDISSIDDEIKLPDHLITVLMMEVLDLGRFGLAIPDNNSEALQQTKKLTSDDNN